jgi:hypothetical protein
MFRKIAALALITSIAIFGTGQVEAKKKPAAGPLNYYLNWLGDCAGGGYLSLESTPNADDCALYFNGLAETHDFPGSEGLPIVLDADKPVTVDFDLGTVYEINAEFEAVLSGVIKGKSKPIASASQVILATPPQGPAHVHFDLEPDAALDKARLERVTLTVTLKSGLSYGSMILDGTATMVINGD